MSLPDSVVKPGDSSQLTCLQNHGQNGLGLNLDFIKVVGFQIAEVLRLFSMKGLSLIHGGIKPGNIFFKQEGVPQFKLLDFSAAFFLDEQPEEILHAKSSYTAPELEAYAQAKNREEKAAIRLDRVDQWALGCLLYELHFKVQVDRANV